MNRDMSAELFRTFESRQAAATTHVTATQHVHEQAVLAELHAQLDPALVTRAHDLGTALHEAARAVQAAQQRLAAHTATPPHAAAEVPTWARRKAELVAELDGYTAVRDAAQRAADAARAATTAALHAAWVAQHAAAQTAFEAAQQEEQQIIADARAALEQRLAAANARVGAARDARNRYRLAAAALGIDPMPHVPTIERMNGLFL